MKVITRVVQWLEQWSSKPLDMGSSPIAGAIYYGEEEIYRGTIGIL